LSTVTDQDDEIIFGRLGANDPEFNLRPDPVHILRRSDETNSLFVSTIEAHGTYDTVSETPLNPFSSIDHIEVLLDSENYVGIRLSHISGASRIVMVSLQDNNSESKHIVRLADREVKWAGPFNLINE
jgi:hypothetical protein